MASVISQETFDAVVRENMEEFEMEAAEAIEEAVTQFESQGVNLLNIIKDPALYSGGSGDATQRHAVLVALDGLTADLAAVTLDETSVTSHLSQLKDECDKDLARRVMAGKNNAYGLLIAACIKSESKPVLMKDLLNTMIALCTGQPDLLDDNGMDLILGYVKKFDEQNQPELLASVLFLISATCTMHEQNRQDYVEKGIIRVLSEALENQQDHADVVKEACRTLRILTNDDDPRAPFGKAHDHAKMIVTEENALCKIMNMANKYSTNVDILGELFLTLARLSVRNEFCAEIMNLGGIQLILETLEQNMEDKNLVRHIMIILKTVAGNDDVKIAIVASNGAELIISAMSTHQRTARIAEVACAAITTIVLRNEENCKRVMAANGAEIILKVMQLHPADAKVQKQACMAVRNLVARTRQFCPVFLEAGAEPYIKLALDTHAVCKDEATAALRDLGCDVQLRCPWKGQGRSLADNE